MIPGGTSHVGCDATERVLQVFGPPSRHLLAYIKVGRGYAFDQRVKRCGIDLQVSNRVERTKETKGATKWRPRKRHTYGGDKGAYRKTEAKNAVSFRSSHLGLMINSDFMI